MTQKNELDTKYAVIVAGGNGAGKSTLIDNVIIPKFNSLNLDINFLCTRQISQNPYPIRILLS